MAAIKKYQKAAKAAALSKTSGAPSSSNLITSDMNQNAITASTRRAKVIMFGTCLAIIVNYLQARHVSRSRLH